MSDQNRINFLIGREVNFFSVIGFAIQAKEQYRRATLSSKKKYGRGGEFRKKYIESYLFHKQFVEQNKE